MSQFLKAFLDSSVGRRVLFGGALGAGGSEAENHTLLQGYDPDVRGINTVLGMATGAIAGGAGRAHPTAALSALASWPIKQMALAGVGTGKNYVDMQIPIAEKNLETAQLNQGTAAISAAAAKNISTSDIARLGLAGAGIGAAGGLGYYLYNTLGPGKKKPSPRVSVTLAGAGKGDSTSIEGEMDTLELSKRLNLQLRRDAKRQLRDTRSERRKPQDGQDEESTPELKGILREKPQESTLSSILNLLRN